MTATAETTPPTMDRASRVLAAMSPVREGDIIPLLQRLQDEYGYLPKDVVLEVARRTGLPASRIFGVATFYAQFRHEPSGRHIVRCCRGTACHVKGSAAILDAVKRELKVEAGQTTRDGLFSLEIVACIGACGLAPVISINGEFHASLTTQKVGKVLDSYRRKAAQNDRTKSD